MTIKVSKPAINIREELADLKQDTGLKGQELMRADTVAEARTAISAGRKNMIINGAMNVAQRGTSAFTANGDFPVDRWSMISNTTDFTTTQSSTVPTGKGFNKSIKIQPTATKSPSNSTYARIGYSVEGYDGAGLCWGTSGAKSATISFWVRASVAGIYSIAVKNATGNRSICFEYTIDSADTWEYKTITVPGVTDGTWEQTTSRFCFIDVWQAGGGTETSTIGTWQNTNVNMSSNQVNLFTSTSNTFYITGVQLEVGSVATEFEHRSYGEELALCQRYYERWTETNTAETLICIGLSYTTVRSLAHVFYLVEKRALPTFSKSSSSDFQALTGGTGGWQTATGVSAVASLRSARLDISGLSGLTADGACEIRFHDGSSGAYFAFDAEL